MTQQGPASPSTSLSREDWARNSLAGINQFLKELHALQHGIGVNYVLGHERLARWRERLIHWLALKISVEEAERLRKREIVFGIPQYTWMSAVQVNEVFLVTLRDEIQANSTYWYRRAQAAARKKPGSGQKQPPGNVVFIGHGGSPLWARVESHLKNDLSVETLAYESEARAGEHITEILKGFLDQAGFAVLVLTAEDETSAGQLRARQNVVHEAGLFQGRLGFRRVVFLVESGLEEFSNIAGLQQLRFSSGSIEQTFYELDRVLEREGVIPRRGVSS